MTSRAFVRIHLLGRFQVAGDQELVPPSAWRLRSAAALVKLLALAPEQRLHREQLMETLWPDAEPDAAANNLRYSLHAARRTLATTLGDVNVLQREGSMLALGPPGDVWIDVQAFEETVAAAWHGTEPEPFQQAAALYVGDLLPEDLYEEWAVERRAGLRNSYLALLNRLADVYERRGDLEPAIATLQLLLAHEPAQESAHLRLMRLFAQTGQRQPALAQFARLTQVLEEELGVQPDPQARELFAAIQNGRFPDHVSMPNQSGPAESLRPGLPSRVPVPLDELIDRRREIAEVVQLLATKRLVTLTGSGGIGKTRLAIAVAHAVEAALPDGAVFVSLAPARNPQMIMARVAHTLGLREQHGQSLDELVMVHLHHKRILIVLDNCEHLLAGVPLLSELLSRCPQVRVLATSRTRLGLAGEQDYPVGPLHYPDPASSTSTARLARYGAVELYERRAREVQPSFALTDDNGPAVAEICYRLRGLPLAIGLAAARSRVLTPQMMLDRLDRPLELLTGGPRDAPERQRTMRNTIQWSYDLLDHDEQQLLHMLSVFAGGWTLAAAEAMFKPNSDQAIGILDGLTSLVNNSLVIQDQAPDLETRFNMLEPVREFGLEQLEAGGDANAVRERHARYFTTLAETASDPLEGPEPREWLDRIEAEHDNFRAALRWATGAGHGESAQRLAGALWGFWSVRGYLTEGQRWLALALDLEPEAETAARAEALRGAGELAGRHGEFEIAAARLNESLALYRRLEMKAGVVRALNGLGLLEMARDRLEDSSAFFDEGLELARQLGYPPLIARVQHNLGGCAILCGDYDRAEQLLEANVALSRSSGNQRILAYGLGNLGIIAHDRGDYDRSRSWLEESLRLFRSQGDRVQVALRISQLGQWAYAVGNYEPALEWLDESLIMSQELGNRLLIATNLRLHGQVALELGEPKRAARLFGAAELLRETVSWNKPSPAARAAYERALGRLTSELDGLELAAAWAKGRDQPLDDAIDYALSRTVSTHSEALSGV